MRAIAAGIFLILIGVLTVCAVNVRHSKRQLAESVSLLLLLLIPPVAGNLIITLSTKRLLSLIGCYVYYLGMDLVIYALYLYTVDYCRITEEHPSVRYLIRISLKRSASPTAAPPPSFSQNDILPCHLRKDRISLVPPWSSIPFAALFHGLCRRMNF